MKTKDKTKNDIHNFHLNITKNNSDKAKIILEGIIQKKEIFIKENYLQIKKDIDKNFKNEEVMIKNYGYENYKNLEKIIKGDNIFDRIIKLATIIFTTSVLILFILKITSPPVIFTFLILSILFSSFYFSGKESDIKYANNISLREWINNVSSKQYSEISISEEYLLMIKDVFNEEEFIFIFNDESDVLNLKYDNNKLIDALKEKVKLDKKTKEDILKDIFRN